MQLRTLGDMKKGTSMLPFRGEREEGRHFLYRRGEEWASCGGSGGR